MTTMDPSSVVKTGGNHQEHVIELAMVSSLLQLILATEGALKSWLGRQSEEEVCVCVLCAP